MITDDHNNDARTDYELGWNDALKIAAAIASKLERGVAMERANGQRMMLGTQEATARAIAFAINDLKK